MALVTSENQTNLLPYVLPRVQDFLRTHWGLSLYYREVEHLSAPQFGLLKLQLLSKQPFIFVGRRVFFPLYSDSQLSDSQLSDSQLSDSQRSGSQLKGVIRLNPLTGISKKQFEGLHKALTEVLQNSLNGQICLYKLQDIRP